MLGTILAEIRMQVQVVWLICTLACCINKSLHLIKTHQISKLVFSAQYCVITSVRNMKECRLEATKHNDKLQSFITIKTLSLSLSFVCVCEREFFLIYLNSYDFLFKQNLKSIFTKISEETETFSKF